MMLRLLTISILVLGVNVLARGEDTEEDPAVAELQEQVARLDLIITQVIREGLGVSTIGLVIGLAGSLILSRSFETMVFGITPTDPVTYVGVIAVLLVAATVASLIPARRASRVDPMVALRVEN